MSCALNAAIFLRMTFVASPMSGSFRLCRQAGFFRRGGPEAVVRPTRALSDCRHLLGAGRAGDAVSSRLLFWKRSQWWVWHSGLDRREIPAEVWGHGLPCLRHENRASARFCEQCGTPLLQPAAVGAQTPLPTVTPAHLAEKIRRHRPSAGERRTVPVLFADAVGSTPLAEQLVEARTYSFLPEALSRMTEAGHRHASCLRS